MRTTIYIIIALVLAAVAPGFMVAHAATTCTTSAKFGICSYPPLTLNNNIWGQYRDPDGTQTLSATSASSWTATANFVPDQRGVISYPEVQEKFSGKPVASTSFSSSYTSYLHYNSSTSAESAYDIWLGDPSHGTKHWEEMIWTYTHTQYPGGSYKGTYTISGVQYKLYATSTHSLVTLEQSNATSGTVNISADTQWLQSHGYSASDADCNEIDYGFEVVSTGGQSEPFQITGYTLTQ